MIEINESSLYLALSNKFLSEITNVRYKAEILNGGTVGTIYSICGEALIELKWYPFLIILKKQQQWYRYGDINSWHREFDIYKFALNNTFYHSIKLPNCFLLEEFEGITFIWMEYINGKTGSNQLHADELAFVARILGEFHIDYYLRGRFDLSYLRKNPAIISSFELWLNRVLPYLKFPINEFPEELRAILNDYANQANEILKSFRTIPITLCHGDVHHDNIIINMNSGKDQIYLVDWDCAGYGYLGEDIIDILMEAFVYTDKDVSLLPKYKQKIFEGYRKGTRNKNIEFKMNDKLIKDMLILSWGYRILDLFLNNHDNTYRKRSIQILQIILK